MTSPSQSIPSQASPSRIRVDPPLGGSRSRSVFSIRQQHLAAAARAHRDQVEQRGASAADMQKARSARAQTGDDLLGHEREKHLADIRVAAPVT